MHPSPVSVDTPSTVQKISCQQCAKAMAVRNKGEASDREIIPLYIYAKAQENETAPSLFLRAFDEVEQVVRDFPLNDLAATKEMLPEDAISFSQESGENRAVVVMINYTNWENKTADRQIQPQKLYFGSSAYHHESQWLLIAEDVERKVERHFALRDIHSWQLV